MVNGWQGNGLSAQQRVHGGISDSATAGNKEWTGENGNPYGAL